MWRRYITVFIFIAIQTQQGKGQTCCSGGTPLTGNLGIQGVEPKSFYIQLAYDYNFLDNLYSGSELLDDKSRERLTQTLMLQAIYAFSEKFSVNALFTYVDQTRTIFSPTGETNKTEANGVGDAVVLFQYTVFSNFKRNLVFAAGPKLPLGKFDATDDEFGLVLSPDLQPGSGSFDAIVGLNYQESHLFNLTGLSLQFSGGYRYATPAKRFEGDNDYRFGNETILSLGLQQNFLWRKTGITPSLFLRYRNTLSDRIDDLELAGTGGDWFYLNPGLSIDLSNSVSLLGSFEIPVYQKLNGTQLTTTYRFNAGIAIKLFRN